MNIKQIKLENFQKHSDLTLDLKEGINIIHGKSDAGKSAIRRSIEWCLFCENISGIQKEGTKKTSVTITFDNGIELERIKTVSINRYILRQNGEEKTWDKFGRDLPDEIKDIINIKTIDIDDSQVNVNISRQLDAPFLIGKEHSGSFRMKLFNKLTGADLIDNALKNLGKHTRKLDSDSKYALEQVEKNKSDLEEVTIQYKEKTKLFGNLSHKLNKINKLQEKLNKLEEIVEKISVNAVNLVRTEESLKKCVTVDIKELKDKIEKFTGLHKLEEQLFKLQSEKDIYTCELSEIVDSSMDFGDLRGKIELFGKLEPVSDRLHEIYDLYTSIGNDVLVIDNEIEDNLSKKEKLISDMDICPLCGDKKK